MQLVDQENDMTREDKAMERYGITRQTNTTFHFAGHKYQRFEDALNYAKKNQHLLRAANETPKTKL